MDGILNDIKTRTFGLEIEMCNVERKKVELPSGYSWSKDESIVNTDGTVNKNFGGEVNTPPLYLCQKDLHELRSVYESMVKAGGLIKWSIYTHIHIYVGDLSVEQLKRVFLFFYVCYPYIREYAKIAEWDELIFNSMPTPTEKYYDGVLNAETFGDLNNLFSNQSQKGFIRHAINISAYFKTKTIEFRTFHATDDFYMAMNCIYAAYRIFYYAVNHTLEDFKAIDSYNVFKEVVKLKYPTPPTLVPLLYQGNPYSPTGSYWQKSMSFNSRQGAALLEAINMNGHKEICVVNGFFYDYELFLLDKVKVSIYSHDAYCHLLYLIANDKVKLTYKNKLSWIEEYNDGSTSRQLALALYAKGLQKYCMYDSARNDAVLTAIKMKAKESIEYTEKHSERLMRLLTTCEYHYGTLQEAISGNKVVFYNFGKDKNQGRAFRLIKNNSDLDLEPEPIHNEFFDFVERLPSDSYFYYFSDSPYLSNMHKLSIFDSSSGDRWSAGRYLYCNKPLNMSKANTGYKSNMTVVDEIVPPDDLIIDDCTKLEVIKVNPNYLFELQKKYIKKVDQVSHCIYSFVVMYDKYTLGGFGFTLPKHKGYDLFQLTDFCTNNSIPKLSKFILYCIQSKQVQKILSRSMHRLMEKVISCAYTHKPVSMKYRGVYTKVKDHCTNAYLAYEGILGVYANNQEVIDKYKTLLENGKRG